jgi:hypothetical protein
VLAKLSVVDISNILRRAAADTTCGIGHNKNNIAVNDDGTIISLSLIVYMTFISDVCLCVYVVYSIDSYSRYC